jgi:hypothetical protein
MLARALADFTNLENPAYNPEFDKSVRRLHPEWFNEFTSDRKKQDLLAMPIGCPRPHHKTKLGQILNSYIGKKHGTYDPEFDAAIRARHPGWFERGSAGSAENKRRLLAIPVGGPRPRLKTKLGNALWSYCLKKGHSYDPEFDKAIRKRQKKWFNRQRV